MISSIEFYRNQLGFEITFASPEVQTNEGRFSHFVQLGRDGFGVMLNSAYDANERPTDRTDSRWLAARHYQLYFQSDDVVGLYAEMRTRGLEATEPKLTGYGFLGFSTRDPDGHLLTFHQPV